MFQLQKKGKGSVKKIDSFEVLNEHKRTKKK